jgi:hypothetical protein
MAAFGLVFGRYGIGPLVAIYFCGMLYYTLHYPAKFAMIQQMFDRSHYQSLTGLLEVQGQTAMMIAGGLGGIMVEHVPLWGILLFDASTYLASFLIQATLPYEPTHLAGVAFNGRDGQLARPRTRGPRVATSSVWIAVAEGWRWLRERPQLTLFFTCSLMPFLVVMAGNYLFPIYVADTLHAGAKVFAAGEITFAIGAIFAGLFLPRLIAQHSAANTIPGTMLVFLAGLLAVIFLRMPSAYLCAGLLLGFGNAGCRVARSALLLHTVPNDVMGRVGGFYNVLDRVLRTLLVMAMQIIDFYGPTSGFVVLAVVLLLSLYGVMQSRAAVRTPTAATLPAAA